MTEPIGDAADEGGLVRVRYRRVVNVITGEVLCSTEPRRAVRLTPGVAQALLALVEETASALGYREEE